MIGSMNSNKIYPNNSEINSNSLKSSLEEEEDEHSQKRAGDSFEFDELFDLNGPNFWYEFKILFSLLSFFLTFDLF